MKFKKFQMGGEMPASQAPVEGGAPAQGGGPEEQLAQMAQQIIQQIGPEAAAMLAQMIAQMLESMQAQAPAQEAPVYAKKGGKLVRVAK
jgi:hypothetical protein